MFVTPTFGRHDVVEENLNECAAIRQRLCKNVVVENIGDAWHRATSERVGKAVAKSRKDAGMTAQQLAERCKELGAPIHRTTITKIEGGRSRFDVGELLILAAALDVPPLVLLYPDLPAGQVEISPGRPSTSWDAYLWATGMAPSFLNPIAPSRGARLLNAVMDRQKLSAERGRLQVRLSLRDPEDDSFRGSMEQRVSSIAKELDRLDSEIRELGGELRDA